MERKLIDPADIVSLGVPNYSHGCRAEGARVRLTLSGQIGLAPDGTMREGIAAQCEQAFANIDACLREAGMTKENLVMLRIFLVRQEDLGALRAARGAWLGEVRTPSTLLFVSGLVNPALLVEIEAEAAA